MVQDNKISEFIIKRIYELEDYVKSLQSMLGHIQHSGESGRGYDKQVAGLKKQIEEKTKQIQQLKRSINMDDSRAQLALMGFTQDADPDTKDDDATESGSIKQYGKEKETETMPLEKNPVQAQDAMTYKDQKGNIWQVVENTGAGFYGLKCTAGPRKGEKIYVNGKDLQSMQRIEDEAPSNVKDSYEMLKLCGFIMDDENWITMNGSHIKIGEGESKGEAAKKFIKKKGGDPAPAKAGSTSKEKKESSEKKESTYKPGDTIKASNGKRIGKVVNEFKNLNGEDIVKVKKNIMGEEVNIYVKKNDPDHTAGYKPAKPTPQQKEDFKKDLKNLVKIQNTKSDEEVAKAEEKLRDKYIGLDLPLEEDTLGIVDWEEVEKEFNSKG